jgi:simple sugar transport system permease protein/ribose transport system permease protein
MGLRVKLLLLDNLIWGLVAAYFVVNAIFTPKFATYANVVNILDHSSIMSMLVLAEGLVLVIGALDLSLDSILAFAPGLACLVGLRWLPGMDPYTLILLTLAVGGAVGWFNGYCIAGIGLNPFVETLAMSIVLRGLVLFMVPISLFPLPHAYTYLGQERLVASVPASIFVMFVVYIVFHVIMKYTTFGRRFVATGGNRKASFIAGVHTRRMLIYAFAIAGVLAAIAGLLTAGRQGSVSNTMGTNQVIFAFAGAILGGASLEGGKGTPLGMLGGALLLGMISNSLNLLGVGVTLVYATEGALIFLAIVIDRIRERVRAHVLEREQAKRFELQTKDIDGGGIGTAMQT